MSSVYDVAVVGAGPAGCSAALLLAQSRARVVVLEKASFPRYKTCGGGLLNRARRLLPPGISATIERECYAAELNFVQQGLHFVTRRTEPIISMTMRADLDQALNRAAREAGALVIEACTVQRLRMLADGVEIHTSKGPLKSKFVIAADGANSVVAKQSGWGESRSAIPALECEVAVREADFARLSETARFDFGIVPEGYAWVFPKAEHLSIGVLSMRRGPVNLQEALKSYLHFLGLEEIRKIERHGFIIPVAPRGGPLGRGRVLLTGDAAGLVDPITAEGITHAISSGQLAAQTLLDCAFDPLSTAQLYQSRLASGVLADLRMGRFLAWVLYKTPRVCAWLFQRHGKAFSELVTDVVMGQRNYASAFAKPINYLRLLKFR